MDSFNTFENDLRTALNHFYDPAYAHLIEKLAPLLGCATKSNEVQTAVVQAIEMIRPAPETPASARSWRVYYLLRARYTQQLTQKETADQLGVTIRHLRREQNFAIRLLASAIWERCRATSEPLTSEEPAAEWRLQVQEDLDALQQNTLDSLSNVDDTLRSVLELILPVAARRRAAIDVLEISPHLLVAVPGTSLRQILLQSFMETFRHVVEGGTIEVSASTSGGQVLMEISGMPADVSQPVNDHLIRELIILQEGSFTIQLDGLRLTLMISLPTERIVVLVVDDNPQLIGLYQRYVQGTRYKIACLNQGNRIFETIEALAPDIIVLDAMLPDVDGWELLAHLHAHPDTQTIPIIVCSVVREQELALELGAKIYLPKPVRHQAFMQALDDVAGGLE